MFSHIMLGASDIEASKKFYDATLGALGYGPGVMDPKGRVFYITDTGIFALSTPIGNENLNEHKHNKNNMLTNKANIQT